MERHKKFVKVLMLVLIMTMLSPMILPANDTKVVQAATKKLNKEKLALEIGKTYTLKIFGTKQKPYWKTSNKKVATVSKSGKVTAKGEGRATITATLNNVRYQCRVTVPKANLYLKEAPFDAKEIKYGNFTYVIPKCWKNEVGYEQGNNAIIGIYPENYDINKGSSNVILVFQETKMPKPDYSITKEYLKSTITEDYMVSKFLEQGMEVKLSNFKISDYETPLGTAFKTEYTVETKDKKLNQVIYDLYIDNYLVEITITDAGDKTSPKIKTIGNYLIKSIQIVK